MTPPATERPRYPSRASVRIRGGEGAPERARNYVLSRLSPTAVSRARAADAALIVSELVTNCVVHAGVGMHEALVLELTAGTDQLRIAVTDRGSELEPRMLPDDPLVPGGFGLRVVDHICSAWGVVRGTAGSTCVWCELPLDGALAGAAGAP